MSDTNKLLGLVIIIAVWSGLFVFSGLFAGGFNYFLDDHQIVLLQESGVSLNNIFVDPFLSSFSGHQERFRPVYLLFLRLFTRLYGLNAWLWYLSSLGIAIVTTMLFYFYANRIGLNQVASICFAFLICIGHQASTYARFGTPETTATLFIAIAFLASVAGGREQKKRPIWSAIFILATLLAALNKEACILMLPAMAVLKIWVESLQNTLELAKSWKRNLPEMIILLVSFIVLVGTIKIFNITGPGYASISAENLNPGSLLSITKILAKKTSLIIAVSLLLPLIWNQIQRRVWPNWEMSGLYLTALLIVVPQILLYSKSGVQDHYLLPMTVGISLATIYPIKWLNMPRPEVWKKIFMGIVLVFVVMGLKATYEYYRRTSTLTQEMKGMLDDLRKWAGQEKGIVVVGNPFVHFEKLHGFKTIVAKVVKNNQLYLLTYGSERADITTNSMREEENKWLYIDPGALAIWYEDKRVTEISSDAPGDQKVIVVFSPDKIRKTLDEFVANKRAALKAYPALDMAIYYLSD